MGEPSLFSQRPDGPPAHVDLQSLENGQEVEGAYAVRERELKRKKNGEPWLRLVVADASGDSEAVRWDDAEPLFEMCTPGTVVWIAGSYEVNERWGSKVKLSSIRRAEPEEYEQSQLAPSSPFDVSQMETDLRELMADVIQDEQLTALLETFLGKESPIWERYREAPAARTVHHAYRYGLLEHSLAVGTAVVRAAGIFPGIDRELALAGALLHDIGKLWAYTQDPLAIELTDAGKLEGEIPLGYYLIRRRLEDLPDFDPERARLLLHIILSHHGKNEHGSPVEPQTREAVLVHFMDNLGGKMGSYDRVERGLPDGESWSAFDRVLGGSVYFPEQS